MPMADDPLRNCEATVGANCYRHRGGKLIIFGGLNVVRNYLAPENAANSEAPD